MNRRDLVWLFVSLASHSLAPSAAAQPYLLRDIHQGPPVSGGGLGAPGPLAVTPSRAIFATDSLQGLWGTDGTAEGTVRLPLDLELTHVQRVGIAGGRAVLLEGSAHDGDGPVLWSSDGTPSGTERLTFHVSRGAEVHPVAVLGGELLFSLGDSAGGELWSTDGTLAGTGMVRDLWPGSFASDPRAGAAAGAVVLFTAVGEGTGRELWRTDGTAEGTKFVSDIRPGPSGSDPERLLSLGARVLFVADDGESGTELWISDATAAGTDRVIDLVPGPDPTHFLEGPHLAPGGVFAFFVADRGTGPELWRTDGTAAGTVAVSPAFDYFVPQYGLLFTGGRILFVASTAAHGEELWISDGTEAGTRPVDICPGECSSHPSGLAASSLGVVFVARVFGNSEIYRSDGTAAGTFAFADLCGNCIDFRLFGEAGGRLLLFVQELGEQTLWSSSGAAGDAVLLRQGEASDSPIGAPLGEIGGRMLWLAANEEAGDQLWRTDGTPGGTEPFLDLPSDRYNDSSLPSRAHRLGDALLFVARDELKIPLWRTDGTVAGTESLAPLVGNPQAGWGFERYYDIELAGDRLYLAGTPGNRAEVAVWASDGTAEGTRTVLELPDEPVRLAAIGNDVLVIGPELWRAGPAPGSGRKLAEIKCTSSNVGSAGGRWVFGATSVPGGDSDRELWRTDGTAAGTRRLKEIHPGLGSSNPDGFISFDDRVWFAATDPEHGRELWSTDGTETGTRLEIDLQPGAAGSVRSTWAVLRGRLLFTAEGTDGRKLWATDGTPEGTIDLGPGPGSALVVAGALYWLQDGTLWRADGTPGGTRPLTDLLPAGLQLESIATAGDLVALSVTGYFGGGELWLSDGTAAGTARAVDAGKAGLSSPQALGILDDVLVFSATDRRLGREPWAVHLGDRPGPFGPPESPSELTAEPVSPTAVRLSWRDHAPDEERFRVEVRTPHGPRGGPLLHPGDTTETIVGGLEPGMPATFRVRAENALGPSEWSGEASATPEAIPSGPCTAGDDTLCLLDDRFALQVTWRDQRSGDIGIGHATPYPGSDRTGTFWFFDSANVELIAKALDGRPVNGAFWSFFGGLSDVEYWVTVTDTVDRRSRTYRNAPGEICGVGDSTAFPEPGSGAVRAAAMASAPLPGATGQPAPATPMPRPGTAGACQPGPETLCLLGGRLKVEVDWKNQRDGGSGPGRAVVGTDKTGYFWFFSPSNVELVVKALDGTPVNGHLWVFWGALTDVEYTITVTDVATGMPVKYHNPPGEICGGADTAAF